MDHDQLKELLPLEAIGRLEGEEARAMAAHLATGCDECERELRVLREALAAMALNYAGAGPADSIWRRLEGRLNSAATPAGARPLSPAARPESSRGAAACWKIFSGMAAAATIALAIATGLLAHQNATMPAHYLSHIDSLEYRVGQLGRELLHSNQEVKVMRDRLAAVGQLTRAVLAPDVRTIKLGPLPPAPKAAGVVAFSPSRGHAMLQVAGLPPAPPGKQYELWWIGAKSGPVEAALFTPGPHGATTVSSSMPPAGERILASAITLEPAGGVPKPTGPMYLKGAPVRD